MTFDMNLVVNSFPLLLIGAGVTIQITVLSTAIGFVIGLIVGVARISNLRVLRMLAEVYVEFFRGTPLLVQIFLFYFALPVITGQRIDPFIAAISACGINSGAYVAEIFRAGIQSVDDGQMEAGRSLGRGCRRCATSLCRRHSNASSRLSATSSSPCSRIRPWSRSSVSRS